MNTSCSLLRNTKDLRSYGSPVFRILTDPFIEIVHKNYFVLRTLRKLRQLADFCEILLELVSPVNEKGCIPAVIDYEVGTFPPGKTQSFPRAPPVFFNTFTLPGINRNTCHSDGCCGMILSGKDIAACPPYIRPEFDKSLDQYRSLNGHVKRTRDSQSVQRPALSVLISHSHQPGHFHFSYFNLPTAETCQG